MAITAIVLLVEANPGGFAAAGQILRAGNWDGDGMLLAAVTQIGSEVEARVMIS